MTIKAASSQDMRDALPEKASPYYAFQPEAVRERAESHLARILCRATELDRSAFDNVGCKMEALWNALALPELLQPLLDAIDQAAAQRKGLEHALAFYADPKRYQGPNQRAVENDPYNPRGTEAVYYHDVNRDHGAIARAALHPEGKSETSEIEAQP